MQDITAIILTKNEEDNLKDCLESLKGFASRAAVIDCGSIDATVEIAHSYGADVFVHPFETHARQFNWALDNVGITTKWCLRIDADERLTPELCTELSQLMQQHADDDVNGISMKAWLFFMGRRFKHGGDMKHKLMVFKTGIGRIEDRWIDEHAVLLEGRSVEAKNRFHHYDYKDMTYYINKLNWYASREAQDYWEQTHGAQEVNLANAEITNTRKLKFGVYYKFPMFFRSWLLFIYFYIFKLGFLDGREGLIYHYLYSRWYRFLVDAKIYERKQNGKQEEKAGAIGD